jgi:cell division transport system permease protein
MMTGLRRVVRSGFVAFWRNAYVSAASIFVMVITLFVIMATILIEQLLMSSLTMIQSRVDINVYFVPDAATEDIDELTRRITALPEVDSVTFTSQEEALAQFRERSQNDEIVLQALNELGKNPLGATIAIRARDTSQYEVINAFLEEQRENQATAAPLIDTINYNRNKESIDRLTNLIDATERASFITMIVLVVAAVLISFNTIRLAIYTAREEIGIMRLVGASNTYIRGPFMLQGIMYGLIAGILVLLLYFPILMGLGPRTEVYFEFNLYTYFIDNFAYFFAMVVGVGVAIGLVSSTLAVARYLRV